MSAIYVSRRVLAAVLIVTLALGSATARLLNPDGPADRLLMRVEPLLDAMGIDVVQGMALATPPIGRRRLSAMRGFTAKQKDWEAITAAGWTRGFARGMVGALLAVHSRDDGGPKSAVQETRQRCLDDGGDQNADEICTFVSRWHAAKPTDRVFVAFARDDLPAAKSVRKVLEDAGYVVFTYLHEADGLPWAPPDLVGACFTQAHQRYVIDSSIARGNRGVEFESHACELALDPPKRSTLGEWFESLSASP
jgi:hypothetical protein